MLVRKLDDAAARFAMNSKRGPRNFYKGKGARNLGRLTTKGEQRKPGWAALPKQSVLWLTHGNSIWHG